MTGLEKARQFTAERNGFSSWEEYQASKTWDQKQDEYVEAARTRITLTLNEKIRRGLTHVLNRSVDGWFDGVNFIEKVEFDDDKNHAGDYPKGTVTVQGKEYRIRKGVKKDICLDLLFKAPRLTDVIKNHVDIEFDAPLPDESDTQALGQWIFDAAISNAFNCPLEEMDATYEWEVLALFEDFIDGWFKKKIGPSDHLPTQPLWWYGEDFLDTWWFEDIEQITDEYCDGLSNHPAILTAKKLAEDHFNSLKGGAA